MTHKRRREYCQTIRPRTFQKNNNEQPYYVTVYTTYVLLYLSNPTAALNGLSGLQNPNPGVFCLTQKTIWKTSYPANRTAFTNRKKNKVLTGFFFLIPRLLEWYAIVKGGQSLYHPNNSERPSSSLNAPLLSCSPFSFFLHDTNERRGEAWLGTY